MSDISRATASSPRAWGWTEAGMTEWADAWSRPHARGGGPGVTTADVATTLVVPTRVGVDR